MREKSREGKKSIDTHQVTNLCFLCFSSVIVVREYDFQALSRISYLIAKQYNRK